LPGYGSGKYKPVEENKPTLRQKLEHFIDEVLRTQRPRNFEEFLEILADSGCEVKKRGKNLSLRIEGQERFFRLASLSENHNEDALRKRINEIWLAKPVNVLHEPSVDLPIPYTEPLPEQMDDVDKTLTAQDGNLPASAESTLRPDPQIIPANHRNEHKHSSGTTSSHKKVNLLIDIENSIKARNSVGYERWAKVFNLKQAAQTLIFLQERNITDMETLAEETQKARNDYASLQERIKSIDTRQKDINTLQKHIGSYRKTKDVYEQYRKSGYSKKFLAANSDAIKTHKEAKEYFDSLGMKKLPTIKSLQEEYAVLSEEKNSLYANQKTKRQHMVDMVTALQNTEKLLNYREEETVKVTDRSTR
jgi:hypothetical protein